MGILLIVNIFFAKGGIVFPVKAERAFTAGDNYIAR
jgi:hypothetical protein